jgi:hypothetical protein
MKLKGIKISREAKILFGLMCLAAAILIWVNLATQRFPLFSGQQEATLATSTNSTPVTPAGDASGVTPDATALDGTTAQDAASLEAGTSDAAVIDAPALDNGAVAPDAGTDVSETPVAGSMVDIAAVSPDGGVAVTTPDAVTPTVEAAPVAEVTPSVAAAPIAARDVQLAELPFLVTEAPIAPVEEATAETANAETTRPGEQRATVNPFSPIVLAPVETAQVADAAPPANDVQVVPVPDAPVTIGTVDEALAGSVNEIQTEPLVAEGPLPEAVLPAPAVASLPRPLPMATTPVAPEILRNMSRTPASSPLLSDPVATEAEPQLVEVPAAIREPVQVATTTPAILSASAASVGSDEVELEPVSSLGSSASSASSAAPANGAPLYAGASPLSSYLRNNDVRFTGSAIGPVSVGIFKSKLANNSFVVILGQTLPETEFVLTSLQGKEAEFSYAQEKQLLTLDLRR